MALRLNLLGPVSGRGRRGAGQDRRAEGRGTAGLSFAARRRGAAREPDGAALARQRRCAGPGQPAPGACGLASRPRHRGCGDRYLDRGQRGRAGPRGGRGRYSKVRAAGPIRQPPGTCKRHKALARCFLEGIGPVTPEFDRWAEAERGALRASFEALLLRLCDAHAATGRTEEMIATALRLLALDPLQEHVHRRVIDGYRRQKRFDAALRQFESLRSVLQRELGVSHRNRRRWT
jgi:hypothetical protein